MSTEYCPVQLVSKSWSYLLTMKLYGGNGQFRQSLLKDFIAFVFVFQEVHPGSSSLLADLFCILGTQALSNYCCYFKITFVLVSAAVFSVYVIVFAVFLPHSMYPMVPGVYS